MSSDSEEEEEGSPQQQRAGRGRGTRSGAAALASRAVSRGASGLRWLGQLPLPSVSAGPPRTASSSWLVGLLAHTFPLTPTLTLTPCRPQGYVRRCL